MDCHAPTVLAMTKVASSRNDKNTCLLKQKPAVVVISKEQYNKLLKSRPDFVTFIKASPLMGSGINLQRDGSLTRKLDL